MGGEVEGSQFPTLSRFTRGLEEIVGHGEIEPPQEIRGHLVGEGEVLGEPPGPVAGLIGLGLRQRIARRG